MQFSNTIIHWSFVLDLKTLNIWLLLCDLHSSQSWTALFDLFNEQTLRWPHNSCPLVFMPFCNHLPLRVGGVCDLLLTNRIWRSNGCRCHGVTSCKTLLLSDLLFFSFSGFEEVNFHGVCHDLWKGPHGKELQEASRCWWWPLASCFVSWLQGNWFCQQQEWIWKQIHQQLITLTKIPKAK